MLKMFLQTLRTSSFSSTVPGVITVRSLVSIVFFVGTTYQDPHTLQYLYTALTPRTQFPEFTAAVLLDGQQVQYYDSESQTLIPKTEWMKKHENETSWKYQTDRLQEHQILLITNLKTLLIFFNKTDGHHTMQRLYGCDWYNNGTIRGYELYSFDGEDLISLDLKVLTWTPDNKTITNKLNVDSDRYIKIRKNQLEVNCVERLKEFIKSSVKVPPEVQVFLQQLSSSADLVCHATGFFPRAVNLTWQRDGEKMENEVELRETLPNQDGSFQKRIILRVSPEDLQKYNYTCVVQHSSLEEDLKLELKVKCIKNLRWTVIIGSVAGVLVLIAAGTITWRIRAYVKQQNRSKSNHQDPEEADLNTVRDSDWTAVGAEQSEPCLIRSPSEETKMNPP